MILYFVTCVELPAFAVTVIIATPELLIGFTDQKSLTQRTENAYEVVEGEQVKISFFAEGRGSATTWETTAGTLSDKTDDSCMLDTTGVGVGQIISVSGAAGNLSQTTHYKILAKV